MNTTNPPADFERLKARLSDVKDTLPFVEALMNKKAIQHSDNEDAGKEPQYVRFSMTEFYQIANCLQFLYCNADNIAASLPAAPQDGDLQASLKWLLSYMKDDVENDYPEEYRKHVSVLSNSPVRGVDAVKCLDFLESYSHMPEDVQDEPENREQHKVSIAALRAALPYVAPPVPDGDAWNDMHTAPKGGTDVLLLTKDGRVVIGQYASRKNAWFSVDGAYGYDPIKWQHVPSVGGRHG